MFRNKQCVFVQSWHCGDYQRVWGSVNRCSTMSITPNYPCLIASVRAARLMGRIFHHGEDPLAQGGWIRNKAVLSCHGWWGWRGCGWGEVGMSGLWGSPSFSSFYSAFSKWSRNHRACSQNRGLTTTWGTETPFEEKRRGRESFGGHHCGNVVNCAFLRPWESHSRAGTCGHGKWGANGGQRPQGVGRKHDWINSNRCGSDALCSLLK